MHPSNSFVLEPKTLKGPLGASADADNKELKGAQTGWLAGFRPAVASQGVQLTGKKAARTMPGTAKHGFRWVQPVVLPLFAAVGCGIIASAVIMSRKLLHVR